MHDVHYTDHASAASCMQLQPLSLSAACSLLQLRSGGGLRAKTVDSRPSVEKVSRGVKWRRLVIPLRGILFLYRSVVHVLVIWAKLINTRGMGIGSLPCNGV